MIYCDAIMHKRWGNEMSGDVLVEQGAEGNPEVGWCA